MKAKNGGMVPDHTESESKPDNDSVDHAIDALGLSSWRKFGIAFLKEWKGLIAGKKLFVCLLVVILFLLWRFVHAPVKEEVETLERNLAFLKVEVAPYKSAEGVVKALFPHIKPDERPDKIIEIVSQQATAVDGLKKLVSEDVASKLGSLPEREWMQIAFSNLSSRIPSPPKVEFSSYLNDSDTPLNYETHLQFPQDGNLKFKVFNSGTAQIPINTLAATLLLPKHIAIKDQGNWINSPAHPISAATMDEMTNLIQLSTPPFNRPIPPNVWATIGRLTLAKPVKFTHNAEELASFGLYTNNIKGRNILGLPVQFKIYTDGETKSYYVFFYPHSPPQPTKQP
jgi:hypothetical protein